MNRMSVQMSGLQDLKAQQLDGSFQSSESGRSSFCAAVEQDLNPFQDFSLRLLTNIGFQSLINLAICTHLALSVYETDQRARHESPQFWQKALEKTFLGLYFSDIVLRMFSLRKAFFHKFMNVFDLFIVLMDLIPALVELFADTADIGPVSLFRALRAVRIVRVIRNFAMFRDLYLMMKGMGGALRAIVFATILIFGVLTIFSIVAVEVIDPLNRQLALSGVYAECDRCPRAFATVMGSNLTFLTAIVAGDSWGQIAVPLIESHPWTGVVLLSALVTIELGLLNVIVAVVVDRQAQAREEDKELQATLKDEQAKSSYKELVSMFRNMDLDQSGTLTLEELVTSYDGYAEFREMLRVVDITREDLPTVFASFDMDKGGVVDYEEFTRELHRLRTLDMRTLLYLTRQHVMETKEAVSTLHKRIDNLSSLSVPGVWSESNGEPTPGNTHPSIPRQRTQNFSRSATATLSHSDHDFNDAGPSFRCPNVDSIGSAEHGCRRPLDRLERPHGLVHTHAHAVAAASGAAVPGCVSRSCGCATDAHPPAPENLLLARGALLAPKLEATLRRLHDQLAEALDNNPRDGLSNTQRPGSANVGEPLLGLDLTAPRTQAVEEHSKVLQAASTLSPEMDCGVPTDFLSASVDSAPGREMEIGGQGLKV